MGERDEACQSHKLQRASVPSRMISLTVISVEKVLSTLQNDSVKSFRREAAGNEQRRLHGPDVFWRSCIQIVLSKSRTGEN